MLDSIKAIDQAIFLWFNSHHQTWLDPIVYGLSENYLWMFLFYILIAVLIGLKSNWKTSALSFLGIAISVGAVDLFTSKIMKPGFARLRPTHDPAIQDLVHTVNDYTGGLYGFNSGHSATSFAAITVGFLILRHFNEKAWALYFWAILIAWTRMYLGVHYFGDILVGAVLGILFGILTFKGLQKFSQPIQKITQG